MNYHNENDPYAAQWLQNLIDAGEIPPGHVDTRSIEDVTPYDLSGYTQCHFFAGIGGWPLALRLAGWPEDRAVWTGSCPCQPFSAAGKGAGAADPRHLWPVWYWLIQQCRPPTIFGEQVAAAVGKSWLDGVCSDLEGIGYAIGSIVVPACAVGAPHRRDRLWFVANTASDGRERLQQRAPPQIQKNWTFEALGAWNAVGNPFTNWKKLLAGSETCRLDDGVSSTMGVRPALRAYGNAIVPQVAAEVIAAFMECRP